jgi:hypothetical protein
MTDQHRPLTLSPRSLGLLIALCALAALAVQNPAAAEPAISPKDAPIKLFDGKSLGDCYTWLKDTGRKDPRQVFRVTDGLLHVTGDGLGSIITNRPYRDYHLVLEYKWGDKTWRDRVNAARDSGLLIHSNGADGSYDGTWMPSIEVQIIEGGVGDFVFVSGKDDAGKPVPLSLTANVTRDRDDEVVWKQEGDKETFANANIRRINWFGRDTDWQDEKDFRGPRDVDSPHNEWTRIDVIADGGHIEVFVNGVKGERGLRRHAARRPHSAANRVGRSLLPPLGAVAVGKGAEAGSGQAVNIRTKQLSGACADVRIYFAASFGSGTCRGLAK